MFFGLVSSQFELLSFGLFNLDHHAYILCFELEMLWLTSE